MILRFSGPQIPSEQKKTIAKSSKSRAEGFFCYDMECTGGVVFAVAIAVAAAHAFIVFFVCRIQVMNKLWLLASELLRKKSRISKILARHEFSGDASSLSSGANTLGGRHEIV